MQDAKIFQSAISPKGDKNPRILSNHRFACEADAEAAISDYEGRGQGRRGRTPYLWRYHALHSHVEAGSIPKKRTRRGRPPKAEAPQVEIPHRLVGRPEGPSPPLN